MFLSKWEHYLRVFLVCSISWVSSTPDSNHDHRSAATMASSNILHYYHHRRVAVIADCYLKYRKMIHIHLVGFSHFLSHFTLFGYPTVHFYFSSFSVDFYSHLKILNQKMENLPIFLFDSIQNFLNFTFLHFLRLYLKYSAFDTNYFLKVGNYFFKFHLPILKFHPANFLFIEFTKYFGHLERP